MKFADVKNDIAFRKIFGSESQKKVLISFLNAILEFEGKKSIKSISILNPYQLPMLRGGKVTIVDIKAKDQSGNNYLIEMQVAEKDGFSKRALYYLTKGYNDQIERGDEYKKLKPAIFIGILNFKQTKNTNYISRNLILDVETGENTIRDVQFVFIELPKFKKTLKELNSLTDKWIYFIKNSENLNIVPEGVDDEGLQTAYKSANQETWDKMERDAYDYVYMREEDYRAEQEFRMRKAKEEMMKEVKQEKQKVEEEIKQEKQKLEEEKQKMEIEIQKVEEEKQKMEIEIQKVEEEKQKMEIEIQKFIIELHEEGVQIAKIAKMVRKTEDEVKKIIENL